MGDLIPLDVKRALALTALVEGQRAEAVLLPRLRLSVSSHEFGELELALLPEPMALTLTRCVGEMSDGALVLFEALGRACSEERRIRAERLEHERLEKDRKPRKKTAKEKCERNGNAKN